MVQRELSAGRAGGARPGGLRSGAGHRHDPAGAGGLLRQAARQRQQHGRADPPLIPAGGQLFAGADQPAHPRGRPRHEQHDAASRIHRAGQQGGHVRRGAVPARPWAPPHRLRGAPSPAPFESSSHLRERYFLEAAKRMGYADGDVTVFPKQSLVERMPIDEATAEITGRIVSAPNRPTAICVEIDEAAFDIMQRLRALGIRVPQDMSVVGFDDHEAAALADLTTIHQDPQLMARAAAQKLLTMMRGGTLDEPSTTFRTTLIPRGSTAPPPQDRP
ncbi:MAG: substrate-binding domain-containing protein [Bifidobacterium scardovii]